ncbi:unnamed protein product [Chrysodeixis includens]|uniref:Uncharacterized protein n=1 Tax=Chrysodeixis includens TaxID=689277 RepID=A0A9P0C5B4_CHRIL|nr:unnamed protein product [Chrysodeixis includens]
MCLEKTLVGTFAVLAKLVFNIIEAVIRALIEVAITTVAYAAAAVTCMMLTALFLRYGLCRDGTCFNEGVFGNFIIVASFTLAIFAAYNLFKRL